MHLFNKFGSSLYSRVCNENRIVGIYIYMQKDQALEGNKLQTCNNEGELDSSIPIFET